MTTQMDEWWYPYSTPNNCIVEWEPLPVQFPNGFKWLSQQIGVPFSLYNTMYCVQNAYTKSYPFIISVNYTDPWGYGIFSTIAPQASLPFYSMLMNNANANFGMSNFRVDFLDFTFLCEDEFQV